MKQERPNLGIFRTLRVALILWAFCCVPCAFSSDAAKSKYESSAGNYAALMDYDMASAAKPNSKFFKEAKSAADSGDPYAQYIVGVCYYMGAGVERDCQQAAMNFSKSAFSGNKYGQLGLGFCMMEGCGLEENPKAAAGYFEKSGLASAKNALGVCYYKGAGTEFNPKLAVELFKDAASKGCNRAKASLGRAYIEGLGVEKT